MPTPSPAPPVPSPALALAQGLHFRGHRPLTVGRLSRDERSWLVVLSLAFAGLWSESLVLLRPLVAGLLHHERVVVFCSHWTSQPHSSASLYPMHLPAARSSSLRLHALFQAVPRASVGQRHMALQLHLESRHPLVVSRG